MSVDSFAAVLHEWMEVAMRGSMRHFLHYVRESGLSMSHFGAIFHIQRAGSCGVTEIGEHLGVTSAAASQMLDRLVQHGLILRAEDPDDRRVKRIELTPSGRQVFERGLRARQGWVDELAKTLSEDDRQTVTSALRILIHSANQLNHEPATTV